MDVLTGLPLLPVPTDEEGEKADALADAVWAAMVAHQEAHGTMTNLSATLASCAFVRTVFANSTLLLDDESAADIAKQVAGTVLAMLQDIIIERPKFTAPTTGTKQ
jgi:hypothetical protein